MRISIFFYLNTKGSGHICVHERKIDSLNMPPTTYTEKMPFHIIEENLDYFCAFLALLNMKIFYHGKARRFLHTLDHALGDEK